MDDPAIAPLCRPYIPTYPSLNGGIMSYGLTTPYSAWHGYSLWQEIPIIICKNMEKAFL